jgi:hypothetical protein
MTYVILIKGNNKLYTYNELVEVVKIDKAKGKAVPLQAWGRPEGSRSLRLPDFETIST